MSSPPELEFRATVETAIGGGGHCQSLFQRWLFFPLLICIHKQECIPVGCVPTKIWRPPKIWRTPENLENPPENLKTPRKFGDPSENLETPRKFGDPPPKIWRPPKFGDHPPWTESQTPVKTLPWPNFVAAGNKQKNWLSHHRNENQWWPSVELRW